MSQIQRSLIPPYSSVIALQDGRVSSPWTYFFRSLFELISPLGKENQFNLENNKSTATDITGLKFSPRGVTCVFFEYLIQRVTDSSELTEAGIIIFTYNPTSESWNASVVSENNPDNAGVVFSITSSGQVRYTTTNQSGTGLISSLWFRSRTLAGKNSLYSSAGVA